LLRLLTRKLPEEEIVVLRKSEIFEAKEAVWQREFGPEGHFLYTILDIIEHAGWISLGFAIEQGLTEAKNVTNYRDSIERFFAVVAAVAVSRYVKTRIRA
jgi:hypothetical protein